MTVSDRIERYSPKYAGLAWSFQVNPDSCGNHGHYEEYIRLIALSDRSRGKGVTHVFIRENGSEERLLGYITLRASAYTRTEDHVTYGFPALEIFELAVSKDAEGQHIGSNLMKFAFSIAKEMRETEIGIEYRTLCSDRKAVPFYEKFGFGRIDEQGEIPREDWNTECIPMFLKLPEI